MSPDFVSTLFVFNLATFDGLRYVLCCVVYTDALRKERPANTYLESIIMQKQLKIYLLFRGLA